MQLDPFPLKDFMARGDAIQRRAGLSAETFAREHLFPGKPVILTDALTGWKALTTWSLTSLLERFPDRVLPFRHSDKTTTLRTLIPQVLESSPEKVAPYLTNLPIEEHLPELMPDITPLPDVLRPNWGGRTFLHPNIRQEMRRGNMLELYIGGPGGNFPVVHWDALSTHAFLMQIEGIKQYWVWPPEDSAYMYPGKYPSLSEVRDIENPDLEKFPLYPRARVTTFTLHPGEMLFVPTRWWHTARILSPSITVSANLLNASNWDNFSEDIQRNTSTVGRVVKSVYLSAEKLRHTLSDALG